MDKTNIGEGADDIVIGNKQEVFLELMAEIALIHAHEAFAEVKAQTARHGVEISRGEEAIYLNAFSAGFLKSHLTGVSTGRYRPQADKD